MVITKRITVFNAVYNCFNSGRPHYFGIQLISSYGGTVFDRWWLFGEVGLMPEVVNWHYANASRFYPMSIAVFG